MYVVKPGLRVDIDKEVEDMTEEEKAVFMCMEDYEGVYEELEDDFLFLANEGQAAVVAQQVEPTQDGVKKGPTHENSGVVIIKDEEEEKTKELRLAALKQLEMMRAGAKQT